MFECESADDNVDTCGTYKQTCFKFVNKFADFDSITIQIQSPCVKILYPLLNFELLQFCNDIKRAGSIVSYYGLDDRGSIPTGAEDFSSSLCVKTGSVAHPAFCPMDTVGSFPGGKVRPGSDADHSPPYSAEVKYE
jgi:hypothetical protein